MRSFTPSVQSQIAGKTVFPVLLVEISFDSGFVRLWSGIGPLTWDSRTWLGAGNFGGVSAIAETAGLAANGVSLTLSGIPSSVISITLGEYTQGRPVTIYLGFMTEAGAVVADPFILFQGRTDTMQIDDGAQTATVTVACESRAIFAKRSGERRWTDQEQRNDYPDDGGFRYVQAIQDKPLVWRPSDLVR